MQVGRKVRLDMTKSELCAIQDNIKIEKGIGRGRASVNIYCTPCDKCGTITKKQVYDSNKTYLCEYCKKGIARKKKQYIQNEIDKVMTRKEQAFEKAVERIQNQVSDFSCYKKAIDLARTRAEMYGSIPEAMVAIELLKLGHKIIPQQKIKSYKVDFLLPKLKMVIEVDGSIYHQDKYGNGRDAIIQLALGLQWRIVHISAEVVSKNIKELEKLLNQLATPGQK